MALIALILFCCFPSFELLNCVCFSLVFYRFALFCCFNFVSSCFSFLLLEVSIFIYRISHSVLLIKKMTNLIISLQCRQITRKIAISSNVAEDVASRLCSAMGKCPSGGLSGDKCALQNTTQKSSAFETTFKIMGLISDAIHPYLTHHQQKPTKPFDVVDETAKVSG